MRCPYCQQNIRVQGRFCPKCGEQIFGLPVRQSGAPAPGSAPLPPQPSQPAAPPVPPPYRPFGGTPAPQAYDDGIVIETDDEPSAPAPTSYRPAAGLHPAAGEEVGKTCPYCRFPIKPGEQIMMCPACKVPHHGDCWGENQGCTTYGCRGTAAAAPQAGSPVLRPSSVLTSPSAVGLPDLGTLQQTEFIGRANNAVILALIGMLCCAPMSLIGLFMGISILSDMTRMNANAPQARGKAIAAIVMGALAVVGWLIYLISMAARNQ